MTSATVAEGIYAGPDGYARLTAKVAECNNTASANYYLDLMLDHPNYPGNTP